MMSSWSGKKLKGLNNVRKSVNIIRLRIQTVDKLEFSSLPTVFFLIK